MAEVLEVEQLVDAVGAGRLLGLSRWRINEMRRRREIAFVEFSPRVIRYRVSDVLAVAERLRVEAVQEVI